MNTPAPQTRLGRWRWVLIPSLALNLVVIGLVAGVALKAPEMRRAGPPQGLPVMTLLRALPNDVQRDLRDNARAAFGQGNWQQRMERSRAERSAIAAALRAEPFDRTSVAAVLDGRRDALSENYATLQSVLLDRLEQLSPQERESIATTVEEGGPRRFKSDDR